MLRIISEPQYIYSVNIHGFLYLEWRILSERIYQRYSSRKGYCNIICAERIKASLARTIPDIILSGSTIMLENMVGYDDSIRRIAVEPRGLSFYIAR